VTIRLCNVGLIIMFGSLVAAYDAISMGVSGVRDFECVAPQSTGYYELEIHRKIRSDCQERNEYQTKGEALLESLPIMVKSLFLRAVRGEPNSHEWVQRDPVVDRSLEPRLTWIGHASFLIQVGGLNIITDPIFGNLYGVFRRFFKPGIPLDQLPPIDVVIISHNHADHMSVSDLCCLRRRNPKIKAFVPHGDGPWFDEHGFTDAIECNWWDQIVLGGEGEEKRVSFTFVPATHWSQRTVCGRNDSSWGGWVISSGGRSIYFAGDTAYADHLKKIADEFYPISAALLPIAPCQPKKVLRSHLGPAGAISAALELNARLLIPMHWGTFSLGTDKFGAPLEKLKECLREYDSELLNCRLAIPKIGECLQID